MIFDRCFPTAALVCSAGAMFANPAAQAQAPAATSLDGVMLQKGEQLSTEGKHPEAAATYEELIKKFPASPLIPEANFRAGYAYYNAGNYDAALAAFKKVLDDKRTVPELAELALSLTPQVLTAKAAKLDTKDPARKSALEEAVKQFDAYLAKYPASEEVESANYGKGVALYQIGKYEEAAAALRTNVQKFAASPTMQDSQNLLALTLGTIANVAMQKAPGEDKAADANYDEAERLLRDIITKRQNLALANEAQFQVGELLLARGGYMANKDKQAATLNRALEAYRLVQTKDYVVAAQKARIAQYVDLRTKSAADRAQFNRLKRVVEKEQEKLVQFEGRADETVTARIKSGQIFSQLGKPDETRLVMSYLNQMGLAAEPEQKRTVAYHIARSYALQNMADKAVEKYDAFQAAYKADPQAQDLPLLMGAMYLSENPKLNNPDRATKYFEEAIRLYPDSKAAGAAVLMQAQAMIQLKRFDDALKVLNDTLAKNPTKDLAVDAEFFRASVYAQTGKLAEAISGFKKVRETYAGTPQAEQSHFQIGMMLGATDPKAGIAELQAFIAKFPNSQFAPSAIFELAKAQSASGQKDLALATFKDLAVKFPKSAAAPYTFFERAKILSGNQKLEECLAVMRDFIKTYPTDPALYQAYDFIAQIHSSQSKGPEAIATYEEFVEKNPKDPSAADALLKLSTLWKTYAEAQGPYLAIAGDPTKAGEWRKGVEKSTAAAERILTEYPDSPAVALALNNLLEVQRLQQSVKLKTPADIEKYFQDLAAKFANKPGTKAKIIFTLAAYTFDKDKAKAIQQMGSAYQPDLKFAPEDLDLYGLALIDAKKLDEAIAVYEKLAKDYPVPPGGQGSRDVQEAQAIALAGLGKAMQEKGDKEGGGKKFAELEKQYSWSTKMLEVNYGLALDMHDKKQDDDAMERLRKVALASKAPPELRAKSMLLLGRIHEENKRYADAIDSYVKVSVYYPAVQKIAAEGLWRGGQLLERQATGELPMPTPAPKVPVKPKTAAAPAKP